MARLEAALKPAPEQGFTVLIEPDFEAPAAEWKLHRQAIEDARARGDRIGIVRSPGSVEQDQPEAGVEYFESEIDAGIAVLASQRSERGKANRLADLLDSLPGNVIGVVADPDESEGAQ
jgi:hypothetical protein